MKHRSLFYLILPVIFAACSLQMNPIFPKTLQPVVLQSASPAPTALFSDLPSIPTRVPTQLPARNFSSTPAPSTVPAVTPLPINGEDAESLHPFAIYPLFRRGLLRSAMWSTDGANLVIETSLGIQVLSFPDLQKRFSIPDAKPLYFLSDHTLLIQNATSLSRLDLNGGGTRPLNLQVPANAFALSPDTSTWVTSPNDISLQVEDLQNQSTTTVPLVRTAQMEYRIQYLQYSPDGKRLFVQISRVDGTVELIAFDTSTWKQLYIDYNPTSLLLFSPDGERSLYEHGDTININRLLDGKSWNNLARRIEKNISANQTDILTAKGYSFLAGSERVGVIYNDQWTDKAQKTSRIFPSTLMIYNTDTARAERFINNLPERVSSFAFSPNGENFLTTSLDGIVRLWDTQSGRLVESSDAYDVDPSPQIRSDGQLAAYSLLDSVILVDPISGQQKAAFGSFPEANTLEARFAGNNILAIFVQTPWSNSIEAFDVTSGKLLNRYPDPGSCTFNRNGSVMACFNGVLRFFDIPSGLPLMEQVPQGDGFEYALSGDGNRAAYCTTGSEFVYIFDVRLGSVPKLMLGGQSGVCGKLIFSQDDQQLLSSTGFVWNLSSGALEKTFTPLTGAGPMAISPDGSLLLVYPQMVNLNTGKKLNDMQSVPSVQALYFQPDGRNLLLQTQRGIEYWTVGP